MHPNSSLLFDKFAKPYFNPSVKVLEIGPNNFPSTYQRSVESHYLDWHTLDMLDHPKLTYPKAPEYEYPIMDSSYDIVISGQVIEHVRKPWIWIKEIARVAKTGGLVIIINPVSWTYHVAKDLVPDDCWRIYPDGMRVLYAEAGLTVELSLCESLEQPGFKRYRPGKSLETYSIRYQKAALFLGSLGWPVERSYDTITIGRKQR